MNYEQNKHKINTLWNNNINNNNNIDTVIETNTKYQNINFAKLNNNYILSELQDSILSTGLDTDFTYNIENITEDFIPYIKIVPIFYLNDIYLSNLLVGSSVSSSIKDKYQLSYNFNYDIKYISETNYIINTLLSSQLYRWDTTLKTFPFQYQEKIILNFPKKYYELRRNKT